jgi:hypothetical protein
VGCHPPHKQYGVGDALPLGVGVSIEHSFLDYFSGAHTYCAIDDKKSNLIPKHFHETYDLSRKQIIAQLHKENENNYGIFFCVNEIDRRQDPQRQRTSKMLKNIRAIWADDDEVRPEPRMDFPLSPNIVVETSKGKYHYYWLTHTKEIEQWGKVMNYIALTYNTDGNAKDLVRVLRVPDFFHKKHEPFKCRAYLGDNTLYPWEEIIAAFPPSTESKPSVRSTTTHDNASFANFTEARQAIVTGSNFHGSILWTLNHWVNCGIHKPEELKLLITDILKQSEIQDERWEARMNGEYLDLNIRDAINFVENNPLHETVTIPEVIDEQHQLNIGYPPGFMGELCEEIYEMAPHPNEEVALMASFALVAGIVGRSYNVLGTGLNLYVALLADSGVGKANLKNSINTALLLHCALEGGSTFKGATRFTGPKALFEMLQIGLSRVCVLEESGLMSESSAGDQKGLTRVMLDIYSSSGKGEYAGGENYSNSEQNVAVIPSPALTVAHVSTPLTYLRALKAKDAALSGDIARVWMMRTLRDKNPLNINRREGFSDPVIATIKNLVKKCVPQQSIAGINVYDVGHSVIDIQQESDHWTNQENQYKHDGDQLRRALTSRAFIKIMKIAAISSVFNGRMEIGLDEYKWANDAIHGEIKTVEEALTSGSSDDMMVVVKGVVIPIISKIVNLKFKHKGKIPPKALQNKGMLTQTNIVQALQNNEVLKRMNDDPERPNPKSGLEKIIYYMVRNGLLLAVSADQLKGMGVRTKLAYKVTDDLLLLMQEGETE